MNKEKAQEFIDAMYAEKGPGFTNGVRIGVGLSTQYILIKTASMPEPQRKDLLQINAKIFCLVMDIWCEANLIDKGTMCDAIEKALEISDIIQPKTADSSAEQSS